MVVQGKCSDWVNVRSGTPEGGLLSPLLFACFVNDLPGAVVTDTLMFADDVKFFRRVDTAADVRSLHAELDKLYEWPNTWKLKLNPGK